MDVVVVESPAKAKTIHKYLGENYTVLASYGHVRDLPSKNGSVLPDDDFSMTWEVDPAANKRLNEIAQALKGADRLILATDPDREGEAISWHVLEILRNKKVLKDKTVQRIVFNAITRNAVLEAMQHPRDLNHELIDAYLARRALDYLVGFTLSPVLWRKLPGAKSAGRVQSVALRLICEREIEIDVFVSREYWDITADFKNKSGDQFPARLTRLNGKKLGKFDLADETAAKKAQNAMQAVDSWRAAAVEKKPAKRHPPPPFTTSTLQQEAARKLGFTAKQTMQVAQRLYEGINIGGETTGLITYMRTDGVQIAGEALAAVRKTIGGEFGDSYVPDVPRAYKTKAKNAQEAHEAIRPTSPGRLPKHVAARLPGDGIKLYELIWKRTIASQMESARLQRTTIDAASPDESITLRATGSIITFDGFLHLYREGRDDESDPDSESHLPNIAAGDSLSLAAIHPAQHFTEPPPRFTEASLVKRLEELGIGRPSTYASILSVLRDRNYVSMDAKRFIPDDRGRLVTAFLESFFGKYVEYDFTADLEEDLDRISAGTLEWKDVMRRFWSQFTVSVEDIGELRITDVLNRLNESLGDHVFPDPGDGTDPRACPTCDDGRLSLKTGRYGAFVGCSNYPDCRHTRPLSPNAEGATPDRPLGADPESGLDVSVKNGRFGPYVQLGDTGPVDKNGKDTKPKRCSLPKGEQPDDVTLERALMLLSLPRQVGTHPESGKVISAGLGRYGPFVRHETTYANLSSVEEVFSVGVNRAVTLIAEKKASPRGRGRGGNVLRELGEHPDDKSPVSLMNGRYGPYVKHGKINATLRDVEPDDITLEQALDLIAQKAASGKKPARKKAVKKKAKTKAVKKTTKKAAKKASKKTAKKTVKTAAGASATTDPT